MCGIAGVVFNSAARRINPSVARASVALLRHRGPDDETVVERAGFFLGHTRLAITGIDNGRQPVSNERGDVYALLNGEIYNYRELRETLSSLGHRVEGESDAAVLPHAYEEWGPEFVERLEGIFAVAVWDLADRRLILCRDRFGVKPLYYALDADAVAFASELKAVAMLREPEPRVDEAAIGDYLAFGYVPGPRTILEDIRALAPATRLIWRDGAGVLSTYWRPDFSAPGETDERAAIATMRSALERAVARECRTETPAGAFLSGGLDSSSIVALMAESLGPALPTFHVGFAEAGFGEQHVAREVAAHYRTDHYEVMCGAGDVEDLLPRLAWHLDNPIADPSAAAEFLVARLARSHVKVVLSGDGGDEVFAGYSTYKATRVAQRLGDLGIAHLAGSLLGVAERLLPARDRKLGLPEKVRRFRHGLEDSRDDVHLRWRTVFRDDERRAMLEAGHAGAVEDTWARASASLAGTERWPTLTRLQWLDMRVWLDGCVLRKADALGMAHAIEIRVPFLDHRLVEAVLGASPTLRLRGWTDKYALRAFMASRLPDKICRRPKEPFQMPLDHWFRAAFVDVAGDYFRDRGFAGLGVVRPQAATGLLARHTERRVDAGMQLWTLLVLSAWAEHVFRRLSALRAAARHEAAEGVSA